jgi:hypothetical protein
MTYQLQLGGKVALNENVNLFADIRYREFSKASLKTNSDLKYGANFTGVALGFQYNI